MAAAKREKENLNVDTEETKADKVAQDAEGQEECACENDECKEEACKEEACEEETCEEEASDKKCKKDKKDEKIAELTDKVTRQMAEFDNFRKRTEKEKSQMFDMGAKSIVEKILPVVDNFERGLSAVPDELKDNAFIDGMDKIYKQMLASLEEAGVTAIEAVEKEFDPNLHNAVMHVDDENYGENVVVEEFQKGYMYHDTVVRHSMVKVAN